jgi:CHAT domain-containing protein/Tfp pilus assembly protein PilF
MKSILVSCLLFFTVTASSQTTLDLLQQAMDLFSKSDFRNTIPAAEKALAAVKKEFGEKSPFEGGLIMFIAVSHIRLYDLNKAEYYLLKQKDLLASTTGEKDLSFISCLNSLGYVYREMGRFQQSEQQYNQVINIVKALFGVNDTSYAKSLNNLASLYQHLGQYKKAEQLYLQAGLIIKQLTGENSANYLTARNNLATLYQHMGLYQKANPLFVKVVAGRKNLLGAAHPDYAQSLNNLANNYSSTGNYKGAEIIFTEALSVYKKSYGALHEDYATALNNLAELYLVTGEYDKAKLLYNESLNIRKQTLGADHPDYAMSLNNLGNFYQQAGQYDAAEEYFLEAKRKIEKVFGKNHPDYITGLNNLAGLYHSIGQYARAEPLYIEAADIRKKILGETHPKYGMSLNNLAALYQEMGQYDKAEQLYLIAGTIWKKELGITHPDYALNLNNLASLYEATENYDKAEPLYLQAAEIRKKIFGENHFDYAMSLNNLASLYLRAKQYEKSKSLLLNASSIWKNVSGSTHPAYATSLNNLAALYRRSATNYTDAEKLYLQAIDIRKKTLGIDHPFTAETQADLALLYIQMGQYKKAEPLLVQSNNVLQKNIAQAFTILSEEEKGNFLSYNISLIDINNSLMYNYSGVGRGFARSSLGLLLGYKSMSLASTKNMLESVRNSNDTSLKTLLQTWITQKKTLSKQYTLPAEHRISNLKTVEAETELLEKEITRRSASFKDQQGSLQVSMKEIQQRLDSDEAAIEFLHFKLYRKGKTDSAIYAAYIIRKNDSIPVFVPLCEKQQLKKLFDSAGQSATDMVGSFYRGMEIKSSPAVLGKSLYKLVWQPLEPHLAGIKKIAYSPAGKLYSVAFQALQADSGLLMDKYRLQQYTSTRQVAFRNNAKGNTMPGEIVLFGDADFSMDSMQLTRLRKSDNTLSVSVPSVFRGESLWQGLPGTGAEVTKIRQLFDQHKIKAKVFTKLAASEENLKALNNSTAREIHLATHGFFLADKNSTEVKSTRSGTYKKTEDPLLRSGIILSGGNYVWSGKAPINGVEDGIVTAYEISQLNLLNTELVVLSACETALGDVKGSEGVFGLQRAFKMAGIKKMIVSLWQVPDKETAELMTAFYSYWLKGKNVNDAFYQAQADMRKKYTPFYWAAFVLVE